MRNNNSKKAPAKKHVMAKNFAGEHAAGIEPVTVQCPLLVHTKPHWRIFDHLSM